jgi:hypothetical protein
MKNIYAYYESIQAKDQALEFSKANLWKDSWTRAGWNPVMLNSSHSQISPQRIKITKKLLQTYPLMDKEKNESQEMIQVRFNRICALHAAGGGWISDYDVLNYGFTPSIATAYEGNSFVITGNPACVMFISKEICSAAMTKIWNEELITDDGLMRYEADFFNPFLNLDIDSLEHAKDFNLMKENFSKKIASLI